MKAHTGMRMLLPYLGAMLFCSAHASTDLYLSVDTILPRREKAKPVPSAATAEFARRYQAAGYPRMVVFWNRDLSADPQEGPSTTVTAQMKEQAKFSNNSEDDRVSMRVTIGGSPTHGLSSTRNARIADPAAEIAFLKGLRDAGVHLADRSLIMRLMHKQVREADYEGRKLLEIDALVAYAEWLVEVDVTHDATSPTGRGYQIQIKDLRYGSVVAALTSTAESEDVRQPRFRVTDRGFEKVHVTPTPDQRGKQLAKELITEINARL